MKIKFDEVLSEQRTGLSIIILNCFNEDVVENSMETKEIDIEVKINGHDVEPTILNTVFEKIEEYVKGEAKEFIELEFESFFQTIQDFMDDMNEAKDFIKQQVMDDAENG